MAEFVEKALEQLLPVFEQLKMVQLFSKEEVDEFIKRCRAFEYKISKRTKNAKDFLNYVDYIAEQLSSIKIRRKEMKFAHRYDEIERPLKNKCSFLLRICTHRFRKLEYYEQEISFLRSANMMKACSQAYTRLLQIYGHLPENYVKASRFEFFDNKSAESARPIILMGLRKFPQEVQLWSTHFEIELRYVEYLLCRRNYFVHKQDNFSGLPQKMDSFKPEKIDMETDDELLKLKLARIVYEQAMNTIEDPNKRSKLVRAFYNIAIECSEFASDLIQNLSEHLEMLGSHPDKADSDPEIPDNDLFEIDIAGKEIENSVVGVKEVHKGRGSNSVLDHFDPEDPELKKILSTAIADDYNEKPLEEVLITSRRQMKKRNKMERESNTGQNWFSMPATEMTDERQRDLELVQMRDALDTKLHYKKPDREVLPKYFQIGRIIESKADFYSSRLSKKERKSTLAEELMADYETLARNKKRYTDILRKNGAARKGTFRKSGPLGKRSKRKNKIRSH